MDSPTDSAETTEQENKKDPIQKAIDGLKLRGIGPALMGGRIAGIAVHPHKRSTWYVAVYSYPQSQDHKETKISDINTG